MQVPRFSPRISLIEMAPRVAPRSGCPGRPTLPCFVCHQLHREQAVTGRIFQALPTQTDTTVALIYISMLALLHTKFSKTSRFFIHFQTFSYYLSPSLHKLLLSSYLF